jgi:glutamate---cysteine ligase / carboxylate-amine ligase
MAIAALIQATVAKLYQLHARNQSYRLYSRALLMENKFRAARHGLDGMLIDFGKEAEVPVQQLMAEYLDFIDDVVDELGSREEINYVREILRIGTGADRQLRIFKQTQDIKKVVDYMVKETSEGVFAETPAAKKRVAVRQEKGSERSATA